MIFFLAVFVSMTPEIGTTGGDNARIAIITSASKPWYGTGKKLDTRQIASIYLRQITFDKHDERFHPVNLPASDPVRLAFSKRIFGKTPLKLSTYWNERYFQGTRPPRVVTSDEAMLRYVANTPGAIGYIIHCKADDRVSVLLMLDPPKDGPKLSCP